MAYQHGTIISTGDSGFSRLFTPAVVAGEIACVDGECWVRLLHTATVSASGANSAITNPNLNATYTDGWVHLTAGLTCPFGEERITENTPVDAVLQVDVFCVGVAEVGINAH